MSQTPRPLSERILRRLYAMTTGFTGRQLGRSLQVADHIVGDAIAKLANAHLVEHDTMSDRWVLTAQGRSHVAGIRESTKAALLRQAQAEAGPLPKRWLEILSTVAKLDGKGTTRQITVAHHGWFRDKARNSITRYLNTMGRRGLVEVIGKVTGQRPGAQVWALTASGWQALDKEPPAEWAGKPDDLVATLRDEVARLRSELGAAREQLRVQEEAEVTPSASVLELMTPELVYQWCQGRGEVLGPWGPCGEGSARRDLIGATLVEVIPVDGKWRILGRDVSTLFGTPAAAQQVADCLLRADGFTLVDVESGDKAAA